MPPTTVSAASAEQLPPGAIHYGKGAGFRVPPGTANGPIAAEDGAPPPAADAAAPPEKPLVPATISDEWLVSEFLRGERITVQRALLRGCLCELWIAQQLAAKTALDRTTAIKKINSLLAAGKAEARESRPADCIRCYWAARVFSGWSPYVEKSRAEASRISFSALRLFPIFLEADKTGQRRLIEGYAEAAQALWDRAVAERLSAREVNEAISQIVPDRPKPAGRARVKLPEILRVLPRLSVEQLDTLIARAKLQREQLAPALLPAAA